MTPLDTVIFELLGKINDIVAGQLGPAIHRNLAILGIQTNDDVAWEGTAGVVQEAGVLDRSSADDHVGETGIEIALDGIQVTDTPTQLHRNLIADLLQDRFDRRFILRLAGKGTVEVHQMEAPGTLVGPVSGHRPGVFGEDRGSVHFALFQAHAVTVLEVNKRESAA